MKARVITAIAIICVCVPLLILGGWFSYALIIIVFMGGIIELLEAKKDVSWPRYFKIVVYIASLFMLMTPLFANLNETGVFDLPAKSAVNIDTAFLALYLMILLGFEVTHKKIAIIDVFYIFTMTVLLCVAGQSLMFIRGNLGIWAVLYLIITTYGNDTFAYLIGVKFGKHKMAPVISPKKSWEGCFAGIIAATILGIVCYLVFPFGTGDLSSGNITLIGIIIGSFLLGIGAVFGDLIFSSIKRYFGMKDFSNLLPGHGGILDRIDSITFNLIVFVIIFAIANGGFLL